MDKLRGKIEIELERILECKSTLEKDMKHLSNRYESLISHFKAIVDNCVSKNDVSKVADLYYSLLGLKLKPTDIDETAKLLSIEADGYKNIEHDKYEYADALLKDVSNLLYLNTRYLEWANNDSVLMSPSKYVEYLNKVEDGLRGSISLFNRHLNYEENISVIQDIKDSLMNTLNYTIGEVNHVNSLAGKITKLKNIKDLKLAKETYNSYCDTDGFERMCRVYQEINSLISSNSNLLISHLNKNNKNSDYFYYLTIELHNLHLSHVKLNRSNKVAIAHGLLTELVCILKEIDSELNIKNK